MAFHGRDSASINTSIVLIWSLKVQLFPLSDEMTQEHCEHKGSAVEISGNDSKRRSIFFYESAYLIVCSSVSFLPLPLWNTIYSAQWILPNLNLFFFLEKDQLLWNSQHYLGFADKVKINYESKPLSILAHKCQQKVVMGNTQPGILYTDLANTSEPPEN